MARPTMPGTSPSDVWGTTVNNAVFAVSDKADVAGTINPAGMLVVTATTPQTAIAQLDAGAVDYDSIQQDLSVIADSDATARAALDARITALETQLIAGAALRLVYHAATAGTARPTGSGPVLWFGTVTPTLALAGDVYWNGTTLTRFTTSPDTTAPAVPTLTAVGSDGGLTLSFGAVADADFDHYEYRYNSTNPPTAATPTSTTLRSVTITGLTNGTALYAQVRSVDTSGNASAYSAVSSATPATPAAGTIVTSGLVARWDASTLPGALSTTLSPWTDSIGGYAATSAGATSPTIVLGPGGTSKAVAFNASATTDQLVNTALTLPQPCTEIIVAKLTSLTTGATQAIIGTSSNTAGQRHSVGGSTGNVFYGSAGTTLATAVASDTTWHRLAARFSGTESDFRVGATIVAGNAGTDSRTGIRMGAGPSGTPKVACQIAEILLYGRKLTDAEMTATMAGLATKWGVSG